MAANASLAALYRPQTFAEVVGQDMVKSILSRAAREDRVAPAYLLSGTRGVGKTTIARIFAKALNCQHAPAGEPCNQCEACRRITQGSFVDVVEIDGASNRGIDDIRRLRDAVGYAPLEGRYKVFIIDEAHMLTKEAFNALLKTLEEPPARVTFILATTEQHKFPVTIVSRCQHFVFRQIPEATLEAHICHILDREERPFEQEAAHLIARRAAGSVRDSMSLLGQVLALGCAPGEALTASMAREVLGLAGQEVMDRLLSALASHDTTGITVLVRELLAQGADMGFFLRELGGLWRNLFLIKQAGRDAAQDLDLPPAERERLVGMAERFTLTYIHAAWQMTLDSQRRILTSLEPSAGLELLLLNLAMLPRLLPLEELDGMPAGNRVSKGNHVPHDSAGASPVSPPPTSTFPRPQASPAGIPQDFRPEAPHPAAPAAPFREEPPLEQVPVDVYEQENHVPFVDNGIPEPVFLNTAPRAAAALRDNTRPSVAASPQAGTPRPTENNAPSAFLPPKKVMERTKAFPLTDDTKTAETQSMAPPRENAAWKDLPVDDSLSWESFLTACGSTSVIPLPMLRQLNGEVRGDWLVIQPFSQIIGQQMQRPDKVQELERLTAAWAGRPLKAVFRSPQNIVRTEAEVKEELSRHPVVKRFQEAYDAVLVRCTPTNH